MIKFGNYEFNPVCPLEPDRDNSGAIVVHLPQERYAKRDGAKLNRYGNGPFCKFKIPNSYRCSGVYAITVAGELRYIGECADFSKRFNMGYGNISPKNCYVGGQQTNCRLNNLIYAEVVSGKQIELWFHASANYKAVEAELRALQKPAWNRV